MNLRKNHGRPHSAEDGSPLQYAEYMDLTAFSGWGCRLRMLRLSARISVPTEIAPVRWCRIVWCRSLPEVSPAGSRSEEHTSELQSRGHLVCRLLLEKKKSMRLCV